MNLLKPLPQFWNILALVQSGSGELVTSTEVSSVKSFDSKPTRTVGLQTLRTSYWTMNRSSISDVIVGGNRQKRKNSFSSPLPYLVRKLSLSSPLGASSTSSQKAIQLRFGVIGPPKSGKTALLVRFLTGRFINNYISGKSFPTPMTHIIWAISYGPCGIIIFGRLEVQQLPARKQLNQYYSSN